MNKQLGTLRKLDPRQFRTDEARDLAPWLAMTTNLSLLGDEIGLPGLEIVGPEHPVGDFRADIVARATGSNDLVIIENQLERTDHDHLGKLLTYASRLNAKYVVWLSPEIRDEHCRALDWLNEVTLPSIAFFGVKLELLQIDGSFPAPLFTLDCKPNTWAKRVKASTEEGEITELELRQFEFWSGFVDFCRSQNSFLKLPKQQYRYWYDIAVGNASYCISLTAITTKEKIFCAIYIDAGSQAGSKAGFDSLLAERAAIESTLGPLDWQRLDDKRACRIVQYRTGNIGLTNSWPGLFALAKRESGILSSRLFSPYSKDRTPGTGRGQRHTVGDFSCQNIPS